MTIYRAFISLNAAEKIEAAVSSVLWVDEIVMADSDMPHAVYLHSGLRRGDDPPGATDVASAISRANFLHCAPIDPGCYPRS